MSRCLRPWRAFYVSAAAGYLRYLPNFVGSPRVSGVRLYLDCLHVPTYLPRKVTGRKFPGSYRSSLCAKRVDVTRYKHLMLPSSLLFLTPTNTHCVFPFFFFLPSSFFFPPSPSLLFLLFHCKASSNKRRLVRNLLQSSSLHQKDGRQLAARARCCLKYAAQCPPSSRLFFRYPKTGTYKYSHPTIVTKSLCHASTMRFSPMSYKNMRQRAGSRRFRPFFPPPCLPISAARVDPDSCQVLNILLRHCQLPTPTCSTVYRERGSTLAASLRPKGP